MTKKSILQLGVVAVFVASFLRLIKGGTHAEQNHMIVIDSQPISQ